MTTLSTSTGQGFWHGLSQGLARAARMLLGLALLAAAFLMGLLLAVVWVLRAAFTGRRRAPTADRGRPSPRAPSRHPPTGEVIDIEAREIGPRAQ